MRLAVALLGLAVALPSLAQDVPDVVQKNTQFSRKSLTVRRGDVIRITNDDPFLHHVFVDSPGFNYDSGEQRPGKTIAVRMDEPGDYVMQCAIHLKMKLRVSVK